LKEFSFLSLRLVRWGRLHFFFFLRVRVVDGTWIKIGLTAFT